MPRKTQTAIQDSAAENCSGKNTYLTCPVQCVWHAAVEHCSALVSIMQFAVEKIFTQQLTDCMQLPQHTKKTSQQNSFAHHQC